MGQLARVTTRTLDVGYLAACARAVVDVIDLSRRTTTTD